MYSINPYSKGYRSNAKGSRQSDNLKTGHKIEGYKTGKKALFKFVSWLLLAPQISFCKHFVVTIPFDRWDSMEGDKERVIAKAFKYFLELSRADGTLLKGGYCWFKEYQKNGAIHYHVINYGWTDFRKLNGYWCRAIGITAKNAVRTKEGHYNLESKDIAFYFGKYLNKKDVFKMKAYYIPTLPEWCKDGIIRLSDNEASMFLSDATVVPMDYVELYKCESGRYAQVFEYFKKRFNIVKK